MADNYGKLLLLIRKPKIWFGLFLVSIVTFVYMNPAVVHSTAINYLGNLKYVPSAKVVGNYKRSTTKFILYWNTFFGVKDMYFGTGSGIFDKCPVKKCFSTTNRTFLPIEHFDAIVFHGPRYSTFFDGVPSKRTAHQKYIFYSLESPVNTFFDSAALVNFYNWTMTYRRDSDIFKPYALIEKKPIKYVPPTPEALNAKTKLVAWFVSNCNNGGSQKRMDYAKALQKYIPVDIYGACGKYTCRNRSACYKMLERDYKFYLSFENSMCMDYITEKMFNILQYNVVPVVLGYSDYTVHAPPHSVINTRDFPSPKELAEYLWKLHSNPQDYLRYFDWKKHFVVSPSTQCALCKLCDLLHRPLSYSSYGNIKDWFFGFTCIT